MAEQQPPAAAAAATEPKAAKASAHYEDPEGLFKTVCRSFMNKKCTRGPSCKNVHDRSLCVHFWRSGSCKFGEECRRNHFVTITPAENGITDAENSETEQATAAKKPQQPTAKDRKKKEKKQQPGKKQDAASPAAEEDGARDKPKDTKSKDKKRKDKRPTKKNTECFEPMAKPVDLRITYDLGSAKDTFSTSLTTRDVLLAPNLFSDFKKGELYAKLVSELETCGVPQERLLKMWHGNEKIDGTHLIADDKTRWKTNCPTFDLVIERIKTFFSLSVKATRFNWYKDTSQWKPFHFDAAAVKPEIAAIQNFTVGVSFGATRDAAFEHAGTKTVVSIPQPDGCVYAFSKDTNIIWRHGILQDVPVRDEGRISVIAWGWIDGMVDPAATVEASSE